MTVDILVAAIKYPTHWNRSCKGVRNQSTEQNTEVITHPRGSRALAQRCWPWRPASPSPTAAADLQAREPTSRTAQWRHPPRPDLPRTATAETAESSRAWPNESISTWHGTATAETAERFRTWPNGARIGVESHCRLHRGRCVHTVVLAIACLRCKLWYTLYKLNQINPIGLCFSRMFKV